MKKTYSKPCTEVIKIQAPQVLIGSEIPVWDNEFGQVPGLSQSDGELLA